jgi:hypothetical protein
MRLPSLVIRVVTALVCAALALAPLTALAAVPAKDMTAAHAADHMPCPSPCDDCGDVDDMAPSCLASCMGLVVAVPAVGVEFSPVCTMARVTIPAPLSLRGMLREPDTPPPRTFLA